MLDLNSMIKETFPNLSENELYIKKEIATQRLLLYFKNSLNREITEEQLETEYQTALFLLISNAINYSDIRGVKSISQGNKKTTFDESVSSGGAYEITNEIKSLLPLPAVKLRG